MRACDSRRGGAKCGFGACVAGNGGCTGKSQADEISKCVEARATCIEAVLVVGIVVVNSQEYCVDLVIALSQLGGCGFVIHSVNEALQSRAIREVLYFVGGDACGQRSAFVQAATLKKQAAQNKQ